MPLWLVRLKTSKLKWKRSRVVSIVPDNLSPTCPVREKDGKLPPKTSETKLPLWLVTFWSLVPSWVTSGSLIIPWDNNWSRIGITSGSSIIPWDNNWSQIGINSWLIKDLSWERIWLWPSSCLDLATDCNGRPPLCRMTNFVPKMPSSWVATTDILSSSIPPDKLPSLLPTTMPSVRSPKLVLLTSWRIWKVPWDLVTLWWFKMSKRLTPSSTPCWTRKFRRPEEECWSELEIKKLISLPTLPCLWSRVILTASSHLICVPELPLSISLSLLPVCRTNAWTSISNTRNLT